MHRVMKPLKGHGGGKNMRWEGKKYFNGFAFSCKNLCVPRRNSKGFQANPKFLGERKTLCYAKFLGGMQNISRRTQKH